MNPQRSLPFEQHLSAAREERTAILAFILVFWTALLALNFSYLQVNLTHAERVSAGLPETFLDWLMVPGQLPLAILGGVVCWLLYLDIRRLRRLQLWKQIVAATLLFLLASGFFSVGAWLLLELLHPEADPLRAGILRAIRSIAPFGLWSGVALVVAYNGEARERERRFALLQAQAQHAQMRALRYQVNPHLLYNTLNSIAALILNRENDLAEAMVLRLAEFFRASLANDPHSDVALADEVALQKLYLDIEQMRFPKLSARFEVPEELGEVRVPSLILQPLIENALKHGVNSNQKPTLLTVRAFKQAGNLAVEVVDDGPGASTQSGTGVGLANVRERLASRYGASASLDCESRPGKGFIARVVMPLES